MIFLNLNCNSKPACATTNKECCNTGGTGYAFVLVLFILIVLVGAAWIY